MDKSRPLSSLLNELNSFNFDSDQPKQPPKRMDSAARQLRTTQRSLSNVSNSSNSSQRQANDRLPRTSRRTPSTENISNLVLSSANLLVSSILDKRQTKKTGRKYSSASNVSAQSDSNDDILLQLMIDQVLIDSKDYKILDNDVLKNILLDSQKSTIKIKSILNKLELEWKVKDVLDLTGSDNQLQKEASDKVDEILSQLFTTISTTISLEREISFHSQAVFRKDHLKTKEAIKGLTNPNNSLDKTEKMLVRSELRIKELETEVNVLKTSYSKLENENENNSNVTSNNSSFSGKASSTVYSKNDMRKSKPTEISTAEHNRLKLELAQTRAELAQVREDFHAEKDKIFGFKSIIEDDQILIEKKDREVANLLSELEELNTQFEMKGNADGEFLKKKNESTSYTRDLHSQIDRLTLEKDKIQQSNKELLSKLNSTLIYQKPKTFERSDGSDDDTDTEDEGSMVRSTRRKQMNSPLPPPTKLAPPTRNSSSLTPSGKLTVGGDQELKDDLKKAEATVANLESELKNANLEFSNLENELKGVEVEFKKKIAMLVKENRSQKEDFEAANSKNNFEEELKAANNELDSLERQFSELEMLHKEKLKNLTLDHKEETEKLSTHLDNEKSEKLKFKLSFNQLENDMKSKEKEVKSLLTEIGNLRAEIVKLAGYPPVDDDPLLFEIASLQTQIVQLKMEKVELMEAQDNFEHQIEIFKQKNAKLKAELEKYGGAEEERRGSGTSGNSKTEDAEKKTGWGWGYSAK